MERVSRVARCWVAWETRASGFSEVERVSGMRCTVRLPRTSSTTVRCDWASARYAAVSAEVLGREERREVWRMYAVLRS